jgi:hypothetical protein
MEHDKYWQMFTESGDPLAYIEYRNKSRKKPRKLPKLKSNEDV